MRRTAPLALPLLLGLGLGCSLDGLVGGDDGDDGNLPPDPPDLPSAAVYVRGSLTPLFQLTPQGELGRFDILGVRLQNSDFTTTATGFVSVAQKLDEIAAQISAERGGEAVAIVSTADRLRAQQMPFRGNPSDVELVRVGDADKAYVPLGGDVDRPGNEVAAVRLADGSVSRVRVGVRPLRVASAGGLVFVCNQYSNYVSVIDPVRDELLVRDGAPVELATDYYCTDIAIAPVNVGGNDDKFDVFLANSWRGSVLRYRIEINRDPLDDQPFDVSVIEPVNGDPISTPAAEIRGVGANPSRLSFSQDQGFIYVANNRGGEVSRIQRSTDTVTRRLSINGPSLDVVQVGDRVFVPTTTIDRGLLDRNEPRPAEVEAGPVEVTGLDGNRAIAHPGAMFDNTRSYNFEDLRNGVVQLDSVLTPTSLRYMTDDISPEPNFIAEQKILTGAVPIASVRNAAGTRLFLAHSSSNQVQELEIIGGAFGLRAINNGVFTTSSRPFALALDEQNGRLLVSTWAGEVLEVFSLANRQRIDRIDLGYAALGSVPYPATNIERGQEYYFRADWSNNGRKTCASCHVDELQVDGIGYSNGATAPTAYHQVRPNWNLMTTDNYFWNGSFSNGSYASLAFLAQSRTNCELILFGFVEGPGSNPANRIGDPNNRVRNAQDAQCRPGNIDPATGLPENFAQIAQVIAAQKLVAINLIQQVTGQTRDEVTRLVDFYSVASLRLPPNPLKRLYDAAELDSATMSKISQGQELFTTAGCGNCHDPDNARAPYTDGKQHGSGADWTKRFVDRYLQDDRVIIPDEMINSIDDSAPDSEINIHLTLDYFRPFCFNSDKCLVFEDPLAAIGNVAEESRRLELLRVINLDDPERGFVPGNVVGSPKINTPSLRGIWWQPNMLHHGLANNITEAVLAPGHPALGDGEKGWAISALGQIDVHGNTSSMTPAQVEALTLFVESIE
jgi:DNA-binding beta-propeller fold protein YncE